MIAVRCPASTCAAVFDVEPSRLGRNMHCPTCGVRLTARPLAVDEQLLRQEERLTGGAGAPLQRLPLVVVVDSVRSLWNVGAIFRTADACAVERLYLTGITGTPPRDEISKTALGAEQAVAWEYLASPEAAVQRATETDFVPVVLETGDDAEELDQFCWPERVCLLVGNEVAGVSEVAAEQCRHRVKIPMRGAKNSLNVAVAFGIAAHAASAALARRTAGRPAMRGEHG